MADPDYVARMREERQHLTERVDKLKAFIGSETFLTLEQQDKALLEAQLKAMRVYLNTLGMRLERAAARSRELEQQHP